MSDVFVGRWTVFVIQANEFEVPRWSGKSDEAGAVRLIVKEYKIGEGQRLGFL